ncbi:MAG TPA: lipopolysaccharide biosynthesis protein [Candidatus Eisenbacteria bacterium]|nr:lipopolysaccharide biosynthesis protein [Candidatus Eisenbacteria bacterium]
MADERDDLKQKAVKSTAWYGITRLVTQVISWLTTLVLARLLTPEDYGLFAMAYAVISLFELFQEFGLGVAIVRRQDLTRKHVDAIFWIIVGSSAVLALAASIAAPAAAAFYRQDRLTGMIQALSALFLLNSIGLVPYNLLTKELDFKRRSLAESVGVIVQALSSLALATLHFGVWALVLGNLARGIVRNAALLYLSRWWPRWTRDYQEVGSFLRFGLRVAGTGAVNTVSNVANNAIVGRFLGGTSLGHLSMAESLGKSNPFHNVTTAVINQLSLPLFSKIQNDDEELRAYFLRITRYLAIVALPLQVGMALISAEAIHVLLPPKWNASIPLLQMLSVGGIWAVLPLPSFPLLTAKGLVSEVFRYTVVFAVVLALVYFIGAQFSTVVVVALWLIVFPLFRTYPVVLALRCVGLSAGAYIRNIGAPLLATGFMGLAVAGVLLLLRTHGDLTRLVAGVATGAVVYAGSLYLLAPSLIAEGKTILGHLGAKKRAS